ncbi:zinc finger protein 12-like [Sander lucioperca]|uniref:zinc finger protein 12-like n=1 Tax=Sander lucioperca TaxID=283035 RepID=UPI00125D0ED6|nr:zinc finger protein 12-like [Sander lucioperca]XP_031179895.1 zinc finger protein 12-like [Sander lucioperca]XP_035853687.1 zinc finger protein 12-like [Sander lucioperca]
MSTSQTLTPLDCGGGEHLSMVKAVKMELLRALVSERLSAAAEEIFELVERTITEYEKEMSCSKWVVDSHRRLLDVAKSHSEDSFQMPASDVKLQSGQQQRAASVNASMCWAEPENTTSEPTEDCPNTDSTHSDPSPASENDQSGQEILTDIEDDYVKQECDVNMPLNIVKVEKRPVCLSGFSSKKATVRHIKKHPEDNLSLYQCQFCDLYFCHKSEFIIHTRTHNSAKPYTCHDYEKSFGERHSLLIHRQKHTEEKPYLGFSQKVEAETDLRSVTPASKTEELACRQEDSGINIFPRTVTPYDKSEFDQESLQPLCLYQIQTVADIDKDSSAAVTVDHIKAEPAGTDAGVSDSAMCDQLLLSVSPSEQGASKTQPKHLNINNILQSGPSGKSAELIVDFEAGTAQKPYKCPCCTKCFSSTKTLLRHVRTHTEDKAYQCHFCGRNFCQKSDLVNHTRIHTGERPYQCQECHKSFAQKGNLVVHMRKHARDKLYQCQESSRSFSQGSSFHYHMQSHR